VPFIPHNRGQGRDNVRRPEGSSEMHHAVNELVAAQGEKPLAEDATVFLGDRGFSERKDSQEFGKRRSREPNREKRPLRLGRIRAGEDPLEGRPVDVRDPEKEAESPAVHPSDPRCFPRGGQA